MSKEDEDLKQQIEVYSALKEDYLKTGASAQEQKVYEELLGKIDLLKDEARGEKQKLREVRAHT